MDRVRQKLAWHTIRAMGTNGAGETTLLRMVTAYAILDNGGRRVKPTLIDRIQDRYGHTVYRHDERDGEAAVAAVVRRGHHPGPNCLVEGLDQRALARQVAARRRPGAQRGLAPGPDLRVARRHALSA